MKYLLDTNIVTAILKQNQKLIEKLSSVWGQKNEIFVSHDSDMGRVKQLPGRQGRDAKGGCFAIVGARQCRAPTSYQAYGAGFGPAPTPSTNKWFATTYLVGASNPRLSCYHGT